MEKQVGIGLSFENITTLSVPVALGRESAREPITVMAERLNVAITEKDEDGSVTTKRAIFHNVRMTVEYDHFVLPDFRDWLMSGK